MKSVEMDGYIFKKSKRKTKKYDVYDLETKKFITSFGGIKENGDIYQHYRDVIGLYSKYNHLDKDRRKRYRKRHGTNPKKNSAGYFALNYLW